MNMIYRGIAFSISTTPIATQETAELGTFLGQQYAIKQYQAASQKGSQKLIYRGVCYST